MHHTNQYYFTVEKLRALIKKFEHMQPTSNKHLKGFAFTPGFDADQLPVVYAFPVFSEETKAGADGDILIQNISLALAGCPYPPKCGPGIELSDADKCYG